MEKDPKYSVIIPVYNRVDEVADLMESLSAQIYRDFEVIIVEDGSTEPCEEVVKRYPDLRVSYYWKPNEGRSIARNYGMERARGEWFLFFDSDCVLPPGYILLLNSELSVVDWECFGGPDAAHKSFTVTQKAINFAMTSMLTTGGIRGRIKSLDKFVPRTFNMGFTRRVYEKVGGFREMFSEDIDMSTRIRNAGFPVGLVYHAFVYHKRRGNLLKFFRQVHVFGMSRITISLLYPGSLKLVHTLPALAVIIGLALLLLAIFVSPWWLLPLVAYLGVVLVTAWRTTHSAKVALMAVPASVVQVVGYGTGFLRAYIWKILFRAGRDIDQEIRMRKGK